MKLVSNSCLLDLGQGLKTQDHIKIWKKFVCAQFLDRENDKVSKKSPEQSIPQEIEYAIAAVKSMYNAKHAKQFDEAFDEAF
jgi:hypothetical protein